MKGTEILSTTIDGCFILVPDIHFDSRGYFIKNFSNADFKEKLSQFNIQEQYFSFSSSGVVRGLHFQIPPFEHSKLVSCIQGSVIDVVVDLRINSPTYQTVFSSNLSNENFRQIFIPPGVAHGFYSLTDSLVLYNVTSSYSPRHDAGVLWNSIEYEWPDTDPIISERDKQLPHLSEFDSPFVYCDEDK